jgi:ADP-ribose pyrophosphatase
MRRPYALRTMDVVNVEVVEDRTGAGRCDAGFLRLKRLQLRNVYADGTRSEPYACDVMSRRDVDAVTVVLYEIDGRRRVRVLLKEGLRPAVFLRGTKKLARPDPHPWLFVAEIAAGVLEQSDDGAGGVERRAAHEAEEECGVAVDPASVERLGGAMFPSPGVTDEYVHFRAARVPVDAAKAGAGDGSMMEHGQRPLVLNLVDAIARCRRGEIPDMKTEIGLLRLCDQIGFVPQLGMFVDELPPALRALHSRLGVDE